MEKIINNLKKVHGNVIISGHKNADFDSLCSSIALAYIIKEINKDANVKVFIEGNSLEKIKDLEIDKDLIISKITLTEDYTFIAVDLNKLSRLPEEMIDVSTRAKYTINIDHHIGNTTGFDCVYSDENKSSTCEIIYDIITLMNVRLSRVLASLLFIGIISDTYMFTTNTSSNLFEIINKLTKYDIEPSNLIKKYYFELTDAEMQAISYIISNTQKSSYFSYTVINANQHPFNKVSFVDLSKKCLPIILNNKELEIFALIVDYGNKKKGELRSKNDINIEPLAKLLTGGGHANAAGFSNQKTITEIIEICNEYLAGVVNE